MAQIIVVGFRSAGSRKDAVRKGNFRGAKIYGPATNLAELGDLRRRWHVDRKAGGPYRAVGHFQRIAGGGLKELDYAAARRAFPFKPRDAPSL